MRSCRPSAAHTSGSGARSNSRLTIVLGAAAELPWINLSDSLEILTLMAQEADPRFVKAAARWIGRLLTETPRMTLKEARWVIAIVEQLPRYRESLHRFARRRKLHPMLDWEHDILPVLRATYDLMDERRTDFLDGKEVIARLVTDGRDGAELYEILSQIGRTGYADVSLAAA